MSETTELYRIRYRFGPLDGIYGHTDIYPPKEINDYHLAYCNKGLYVYVWPTTDMRRAWK